MDSISIPTIKNVLFDNVSIRTEFAVRVIASALLGFGAWQDSMFLPSLIFFALFIVYTRSALMTWASAFSYYLTASYGLSTAYMNFFPEGLPILGYVFWILSAILISVPWALSRKLVDLKCFNNIGDYRFAVASLTGMVISLIPPISWIHWVHPGLVSGMFFPDWGLTGLFITFVLISLFPLLVYKTKKTLNFVGVTVGFATFVLYQTQSYVSPAFASGVGVVSTDSGEYKHSDGYERIKHVAKVSEEAVGLGVPIVLFPESYMGVERDSIHSILSQVSGAMKDSGVTALVGMEANVSSGVYDNALYGFGAETGVIYKARLPMPLNGLPFAEHRQTFNVFSSPVKEVSGQNYFFAICYEGYLLEHAVMAMVSSKKPEAMLVSSNLWALKGLHLAKIQNLSILMMSRMMGIPLEWSRNT